MILREFLYVDTVKVRGLLAQLEQGITETSSTTQNSSKSTGAGIKGFAEHAQQWGSAETTQKSYGDMLFPILEDALEAHGMLLDLSEPLAEEATWNESLRTFAPPGQVVRVTGDARLFDARFVAHTLEAFATVGQGLGGLETTPSTPPRPGASRPGKNQAKTSGDSPTQLEDAIPEVKLNFGGTEIEGSFLRAIVRIARGMFRPGLHFVMTPTPNLRYALTARLEEGRHFLDGEPDVLFARYGTNVQEWTVVGLVGHHGEDTEFDASKADFLDVETSKLSRPSFAAFVNDFLSNQGTIGFADAPQAPGFSIVPLAVYRVLPGSALGRPDELEID